MKVLLTSSLLVPWIVLATVAQAQQGESAPENSAKAAIKECNQERDIVDIPVRRNVFTNQVGYLSHAAKYCLVEGLEADAPGTFSLVNVKKGRALAGKLQRVSGDFGAYHVGDFSKCTQPGEYQVWVRLPGKTLSIASYKFRIADDINDGLINKGLDFFTVQRCGPSTTGYNKPCHLDDAIRKDNGKRIDLVGGWHNSSDLLKWSGPTVSSVPGLLNVAALTKDAALKKRVFEEVKWGNLYLHKMQDPAGYVYSCGVGGDPVREGNHWTDNIPGTADDRKADTKVASIGEQHTFIWAQALVAEVCGGLDPDYASLCLGRARRCLQWVIDGAEKRGNWYGYYDTGTGIAAGLHMFQATKEEKFKEYAVKMADRFTALQERQWIGNQKQVRGFFYSNSERKNGVYVGLLDPLSLIALCEIIDALPDHPKAKSWRQALEMHVRDYVQVTAGRNAFGLVPRGMHLKTPTKPSRYGTGGIPCDRKLGDLGYRYFAGVSGGARNSYRAGLAVALFKTARLFDKPDWAALAQRQLDWIYGANPFGMCLVIGVGHAVPPEYVFTGFQPRTPEVPGTPLQGIFGDQYDRPDMMPGHYVSSEPWIIHNAFLVWGLAEAKTYHAIKEQK